MLTLGIRIVRMTVAQWLMQMRVCVARTKRNGGQVHMLVMQVARVMNMLVLVLMRHGSCAWSCTCRSVKCKATPIAINTPAAINCQVKASPSKAMASAAPMNGTIEK